MVEEENPNRLQKLAKHIPSLGMILIIVYSQVSTSAKLVVKLLPSMHPIMIVITRSLITTIIYGFMCMRSKHPLLGRTKEERNLLILRGSLGFISFTLSYWAMSYIPLADNITILMTAPIYTSLCARIFLKEPFGLKELIFIIITLIGVVMIAQPEFLFRLTEMEAHELDRLIGIAMAVVGAIITAVATIIVRKLKNTPSEIVVFWFGSFCFVLGSGFAFCLEWWKSDDRIRLPADIREASLLLANGLAGMTGQALFTMALQIEEAGIISLVRSVDVVHGFLAQWMFLNEPFRLLSIIGSIVVVIGLTLAAWYKLRARRQLESDKIAQESLAKESLRSTANGGLDNPAFLATTTLNELERGDKSMNGVCVQMQIHKNREESEKTL